MIAEVLPDPKRLLQHREGVLGPALVERVLRQLIERHRRDSPVRLLACVAQILLVQRSRLLEVAEVLSEHREVKAREQCVVLVPEVAELSQALGEELPPHRGVAGICNGMRQQEARVGDAPGILESAVQLQPLAESCQSRPATSITRPAAAAAFWWLRNHGPKRPTPGAVDSKSFQPACHLR
jgi:hypothetical protein